MKSTPVLALVGALLSNTVVAVGTYGEAIPKTDAGARFEQLDRNGDGYLSRDELAGQPSIDAELDRLDSNGDGWLDESEFSAFEPARDGQRKPQ